MSEMNPSGAKVGSDPVDLGVHTQKVVAIANQRGGTGKTTTAVNLATCLAERGQATLLIDLDPLGNATSWILGDARRSFDVSESWTDSGLENSLIECPSWGIDLVASSEALLKIENQGVLRDAVEVLGGCAIALVEVEDPLTGKPRPIPEHQWIIIDCPQSLGLLTMNAFLVATTVLVPVDTSLSDLEGLKRFSKSSSTQ